MMPFQLLLFPTLSMPSAKYASIRSGALLYLLLTCAWPALKLLGLTPASWWRVTSLLWGPWLLLVVLAVLGLVMHWFAVRPRA